MAKKKYEVKTDITKQYVVKLYIKDDPEIFLPVVCNVEAVGSVIVAKAAENPELFEIHRFYDEFFQWLLYTGEIKLYINDVTDKE